VSPIPVSNVSLEPCWRIIPSRYPPADLLERISSSDDWPALADIESLTNDRLRHETGLVNLMRPDDAVSGPGSSLIMAPFTHLDPNGDHFTDGTFGVCFAASTFEASLEWSIRRREAFLQDTNEPPINLQMRVLNMDLNGALHDLCGDSAIDLNQMDSTRTVGCQLRGDGSYGVIFNNAVIEGARNVAVFRPSVLSNCRQERHLAYKWDGERIASVYDFSTDQVIHQR